jgi:hypothetical protein
VLGLIRGGQVFSKPQEESLALVTDDPGAEADFAKGALANAIKVSEVTPANKSARKAFDRFTGADRRHIAA